MSKYVKSEDMIKTFVFWAIVVAICIAILTAPSKTTANPKKSENTIQNKGARP